MVKEEKGDLLHGWGYVMGRGRVSIQLFSHLLLRFSILKCSFGSSLYILFYLFWGDFLFLY
jgi:hypothetical protein